MVTFSPERAVNAAIAWSKARRELLELSTIKDPLYHKRLNELSEAEDDLVQAVKDISHDR